ncbi:MaoC/PaaZ C-terminal domain-containing protein [Microvirga sp. W0021]|uniref:MaoC/PaaZ C-terminal domain-containing protein n=1 Tax=Hohaiivirga grylli TaxID=3133970 RepID=A0ABV0BIC3_9HYPH
MTVERSAGIANLPTLYFEDLAIGQFASVVSTVSELDIISLENIEKSEFPDENTAFCQSEFYTDRLRFGQHVAHGAFTSNLVTALISTQLPGVGGIYLSQTFQYLAPVSVGDLVTARVEIIELIEARKRVRLFCECLRDYSPVLEGEAWIAMMSRPDGHLT